ncbi:MAG: hypothetical protein AB1599_10510, partial [Planctomycetota bacterium]
FQNTRWLDPVNRIPFPSDVAQAFIERPWTNLQRVRTSAEVPDNGALVLGGFEVAYKQDITASTPLMDKIPILAPFFRKKVQVEEKSNQFIIVRAKIIELDELEKELR